MACHICMTKGSCMGTVCPTRALFVMCGPEGYVTVRCVSASMHNLLQIWLTAASKSNILVSSTVRFDECSWDHLTTVSRAMLFYAISAWPTLSEISQRHPP